MRVNGLEVHTSSKFNASSLVSAGNNESPLHLWVNAANFLASEAGVPYGNATNNRFRKLLIYNNSLTHTYTMVHVTQFASHPQMGLEFADDSSGVAGTYAADKTIPVTLAPGQSAPFWVRMTKVGTSTSGFSTDDVILRVYANQDLAGSNTYQYNAGTVLSMTKRLQSKPFPTYSIVEGVKVQANWIGTVESFMASADGGANWEEVTPIVNNPYGAASLKEGRSLILRAELADAVLDDWTIHPMYKYRM